MFDYCQQKKLEFWNKKKLEIVKKLKGIPDCYLELSWDFDHSFVPFMGKLCPKDTYKIWKIGSSVRLDFTLVGYGKLKSKRRDMSLIFRDGRKCSDEHKGSYLLLLNKSKNIVVDPLEELD